MFQDGGKFSWQVNNLLRSYGFPGNPEEAKALPPGRKDAKMKGGRIKGGNTDPPEADLRSFFY